MGLFQKKPDPIAEREKLLKEQLAAVEAEIKKLSQQQAEPAGKPAPEPAPSAPPPAPSPQPRLRSTALPHGQSIPPAAQPEPIFEEISQSPFDGPTRVPATVQEDIGTRRSDLPAFWDRIKNHFRGPSTSNPKLVSYLAAGSIQGLRPLRYEKRVARNRFIVLAIFLLLVLWGLIAIFFRK
jgi:hypothetical protein